MVKRTVPLAVGAVIIAVVGAMTFSVVPETKQALILSFGQPIRVVNAYKSNEDFGKTGAGVVARIPLVEQIQWIDKRILSVQMDRQQVLSTDQLNLLVDAFARYRITDPLKMYTSIRTEEALKGQLKTILGSRLRSELGKRPFAALLSAERGEVMENIQRGLNDDARKYGAEIIDVRIKRADLPEGTPLDSAFARMRTARKQAAITIDAEGRKKAQIIRAEADGQAAKIYADSFGKDPEFYDFYRAMQSYRQTFNEQNKGDTTVILSPDNAYLKEFRGR
ncbi:protease modulator HflC [Pseudonocardia sp. TMWB2A]|uniref:protease modulator HflC n=1 Tax=Pseudonocardia sp. TMWB2A TaxID=687430 RepID=UPI00307F6C3F